MILENYIFGQVKISGVKYSRDLLICKNQIIKHWKRVSGHTINFIDIQDYLDPGIKSVIIGKGAWSLLKIDRELQSKLSNLNIELYSEKTKKAIARFNKSKNKENIVAVFHLTC